MFDWRRVVWGKEEVTMYRSSSSQHVNNISGEDENFISSDENILWYCHYCGEENELLVDFTIEGKQDFVEDCCNCCRPNRIIISRDYEENVFIDVRLTDE